MLTPTNDGGLRPEPSKSVGGYLQWKSARATGELNSRLFFCRRVAAQLYAEKDTRCLEWQLLGGRFGMRGALLRIEPEETAMVRARKLRPKETAAQSNAESPA